MVGIPTTLATRQDWLNAFSYAQAKNSAELKAEFRGRLAALKETRYMKTLKADAAVDPEEQTMDDFEDTPDPASPFIQSGLDEAEIDQMLEVLNA